MLGRGLVEKADVEYICMITEIMQKLSLSRPSCSKGFDFALRKLDLFFLTSRLDYFLWVKMTCAEEVGGVQDYKGQFQRRGFSGISCIPLLRNVRQLRKQNKTSTENSSK